MKMKKLTRREFLKVSTAAGGGLMLGFTLGVRAEDTKPATKVIVSKWERPKPGRFTPNAWFTVGSDDTVTIRVGSSEMGQGTLTGIAMLIAEELDADWSRVRAEHAPTDAAYKNPIFGRQATGGSTAIRGFWTVVREAGAVGRALLLQAAAHNWGVDPGECRTRQGEVVHEARGLRARYGALAADASALPVPHSVFLKEPDEFTLIGRPMPRLDTPDKVNGAALFGMDMQLPDMLTATVARCPIKGGRVKSFDDTKALAVPGVRQVAQISAGIAVMADHFWAAKQGRDALVVAWDTAGNEALDSAGIEARFKDAVNNGVVERNDGNAAAAIDDAARQLVAIYTVPYQAHVCMEPMNATADVRSDSCDVYAPTQAQTASQDTAMGLTGLPREKVQVHTTFLGGGFGRRSEVDFITDAVECLKLTGRPVKVVASPAGNIASQDRRSLRGAGA